MFRYTVINVLFVIPTGSNEEPPSQYSRRPRCIDTVCRPQRHSRNDMVRQSMATDTEQHADSEKSTGSQHGHTGGAGQSSMLR